MEKHVRRLILVIFLLPPMLFAASYEQGRIIASQAYQKAIQDLSVKKTPEELLGKIYQGIPNEARLSLAASKEEMNRRGKAAFQSNPLNKILLEQAIARAEQKKEQKDNQDISSSAELIKQSEVFVNGGCYDEAANCQTQTSQQECFDKLGYEDQQKREKLVVKREIISSKPRLYIPQNRIGYHLASVRLNKCGYGELYCRSQNLVNISDKCQQLKISVINLKTNNEVKIQNTPTCENPVVQFSVMFFDWHPQYKLKVEQIGLSEHWENTSNTTSLSGVCYPMGVSKCLEGNVTKIINGISVTRPCWKKSHQYQCSYNISSSCKEYIHNGCQQVKSRCISSNNGLCMIYQQTFHCSETVCKDKKKICVKKVDCADGSCHIDAVKNASKEELGEGLVNLAALAGSGHDLANKNISDPTLASMFASQNYTCRKDGFDIGNCCVDRAREFSRCKEEGEKKISQAKAKHLALYVGTYKNGWFGFKKRESWCVFSSRLAYLIRVSGGLQQLGIGFGEVHGDYNGADCRGLTPEEMSHIKLDAIDLRELEEEAKKLFVSPDGSSIQSRNSSHVRRLADGGVAYDR